MSGAGGRLAAIDVGSNTILLTVAEAGPDGLTIIEEAEDQPRLGAGVRASGRLQNDAIQRALQTLTQMRDTCRRLNARRIGAVATAAVREAANGDEFVRRVRELDIPLRTITPEAEAALAYRSAAYRFGRAGRMLVADIGGGSLELIGAADGAVALTLSLPLGAVRLTERRTSRQELQRHIHQELVGNIPGDEWRSARIIGSGGTFATLASMVLAARGEDRHDIHGLKISGDEVQRLLQTVAGMSLTELRQLPGLRPERADIIRAGLALVVELLSAVHVDSVTVSAFGLRDGLLLEMMGGRESREL